MSKLIYSGFGSRYIVITPTSENIINTSNLMFALKNLIANRGKRSITIEDTTFPTFSALRHRYKSLDISVMDISQNAMPGEPEDKANCVKLTEGGDLHIGAFGNEFYRCLTIYVTKQDPINVREAAMLLSDLECLERMIAFNRERRNQRVGERLLDARECIRLVEEQRGK